MIGFKIYIKRGSNSTIIHSHCEKIQLDTKFVQTEICIVILLYVSIDRTIIVNECLVSQCAPLFLIW